MATYDLNIIVVAGVTTRPLSVADFATAATGAATEATLTDGTLRVGGTVAVTGPATDTQLRASALPVSAVALPLPAGAASEVTLAAQKANLDYRYAGGKSAYTGLLSTAGDNTVITPAAGKRIQVVWVNFLPNSDNTVANLVTVKFGTGAGFYLNYAVGHFEVFTGAVDQSVVVNLTNAQPVAVTIHYSEIA